VNLAIASNSNASTTISSFLQNRNGVGQESEILQHTTSPTNLVSVTDKTGVLVSTMEVRQRTYSSTIAVQTESENHLAERETLF